MATWKLYWVTVPTPIENCFVVAKNSRSAAALEEAYDGFESGDCEADLVVPIPDRYFEIAKQKRLEWLQQNGSGKSGVADTSPWPDFAREWLLESIGATSTVQEGREIWLLDGRRFVTGSFEESYLNREPELIRSTVDLINRVTALPNGRWLYRGQRISTWKFECSLDREKYRKTRGNLPRADYERRMFEQFKLRALP